MSLLVVHKNLKELIKYADCFIKKRIEELILCKNIYYEK